MCSEIVTAMKFNYARAKSLCTESEYALVTAAKVDALSKATPAALRKLAAQARKLSDKWLGLSRKQSDAARSEEKHELFKNVLTRIEDKLAAAPATPAKAVKNAPVKKAVKKVTAKKTAKKAVKKIAKKVAKKAVKKAAKKVAKKAVKAVSTKPLPLARQAKQNAITTKLRVEKSGLTTRMRGHVSSQGRRNQAARSARKR